MTETIGVIEAAMRADAEALRVIGQNIANAEVTAYRRQIPINQLDYAQVVSELDGQPPMSFATAIDSRPGTLRSTGEALDLAIEGSGYFALQSPSGVVLTRRGDFRVNADGVLSSASGLPVLGTGGPIAIGASVPTIDADGSVRIEDEIVGQLQLVHVAADAPLQYLGEGLYTAPVSDQAGAEGYGAIRQGVLETSNVTPVGEMVQLMETLRHFEASQRLARGYDQMLEKAISELGKIG